jgi:large conductance mechanosensitive channel
LSIAPFGPTFDAGGGLPGATQQQTAAGPPSRPTTTIGPAAVPARRNSAAGLRGSEREPVAMASILKEFRQFLLKGNIIDLAVAFIAGVAFTAVVSSLVNDVIMQLIAAIVGKPDFSDLTFTINDSVIRYGSFLTVLINFVLTMAAVFFFLVKPINAVTQHLKAPEDEEPGQRECPECLAEVPAKATRCRYCTTQLQPAG